MLVRWSSVGAVQLEISVESERCGGDQRSDVIQMWISISVKGNLNRCG